MGICHVLDRDRVVLLCRLLHRYYAQLRAGGSQRAGPDYYRVHGGGGHSVGLGHQYLGAAQRLARALTESRTAELYALRQVSTQLYSLGCEGGLEGAAAPSKPPPLCYAD